MLFKQRNVRQSKFSSRIRSSSRTRREYVATVYSTVLVQVILAATLLLAAVRSYQAVAAHGGISVLMTFALPAVFTAGALLVGRSAARNIARARWMRHERSDHDDENPPSQA